MPAPLAKGIIIAASVLIAAGVAVYENPQVRQWVDQSRRKIAIALHSLGDDVQPPSTEENDEDERRRQREELMYWNMKRDEQRRARKQRQASSKTSFDDLVTKEGNLKKEEVDADVRSSTATEVKEGEDGLRRRNERHKESAGSTTIANPFADQNESQVLFDRSLIDISNEPRSTHSRSSTATLPTEHSILPTQPESPIRTAPTIQPAQPPAPREQQLVDTSSSSSSRSSSHHHHHTPSNYQSVNEWASSTFPSFYEVPHEVPHSASHSTSPLTSNTTTPQIASIHSSVAPSLADSGEDIGADSSIDGGEEGRYMDILSEAGISTPGSWTEVGSEVSEEDHGA